MNQSGAKPEPQPQPKTLWVAGMILVVLAAVVGLRTGRERRMGAPQPKQPGDPERMRRHLSKMERLMESMREEMDALEGGR